MNDYEALKIWIDLAQFAVMAAIGIWMYLEKRHDKTSERISGLESAADKRHDAVDARLVRVETHIEHLPKTDDLEKLYERVRLVDHRTSHMEGEFREVRRTLGLIHEYLMKERP